MKAEKECLVHFTITPREARIIRAALNEFTDEDYRADVLRMMHVIDHATSYVYGGSDRNEADQQAME